MAVSTTTTYSGPYFPNGVTVAFPFDFQVVTAAEVAVVLRAGGADTVADPAAYTVTLTEEGGTVTFASAPASGSELYVTSDPLFTQMTKFSNQAYNPTALNTLFDRDAIRAQHLKGLVDRSVIAPIGEAGLTLPAASERADKYSAYDAEGRAIALYGSAAPSELALSTGAEHIGTEGGLNLAQRLLQFTSSLGGSFIGWIQDGAGSVARTILAKLREAPLSPEDFGAVGDGVTDDQAAFEALSAAITAQGGGVIQLRKGATYLAGKQTENSGGYYQAPGRIISVSDLPFVDIRTNGATIKFKDGLKFGGFDPATGLPLGAVTTDPTKAAHIGYAIFAQRIGTFRMSGGLTINCNSTNAIIGGPFSDTGRQCVQYGVAVHQCGNADVRDVVVNDSCLDGFVYGWAGLTTASPPKPATFTRCQANRSGRNNFSLIGSNAVVFDQCVFQRAGEAPNTVFGIIQSMPASCLDIEAEGAVNRNIVAKHCKFLAGATSINAIVADSGDSADGLFEDCTIIGPVWLAKPRFVLNRVKLNGYFAKLWGGQANPLDNSRILNSTLSDVAAGEWTPIVGKPLFDMAGAVSTPASPVVFENCDFTIAHNAPNGTNARFMRDCKFHIKLGTNNIADNSHVMTISGSVFERPIFYEELNTSFLPSTAFFISGASTATINGGVVIPVAGQYKLRWNNSAAGYPSASKTDGNWTAITMRGAQVRLNARLGWNGDASGNIHIAAHNVTPASGFWDGAALNGLWPVGSFIFNDTPGSGKILGWRCTTAPVTPGTSGTWKAIVAVEQQAVITAPTGGTTIDAEARVAINAIRTALTAAGVTL